MKIEEARILESFQWDTEQITGEDAPIKAPRQSWALNWPLLIGTIVIVLLCTATAVYRYNRQIEVLPSHLLALADQAEQKEDWQLVIRRLKNYLKMRSDDIEVTRRLADIYFERAETFDETRSGMLLYSRCLPGYSNEDGEYAKVRLRYLKMLSRIYPDIGLSELDQIIPRSSDLNQVLEKEPGLVEAIRLRTLILEHQLPEKLFEEKKAIRAHLIEDYEVLATTEPDNAQILQKLALLYRQHADALDPVDFQLAEQVNRKADRAMDKAVETDANDIDVLLERFQYRLRYSQSRHPNTSDLQRSLELDKSNPRALLNLAFYLAGSRTDPNQTSRAALLASRDFLNRSIESLPKEAFVLVALASIHIQLQNETAAAEYLQQAAGQFPDSHIVNLAQTELALSQHRFGAAAAGIRRIREAARKMQQMAASSPEELHSARLRRSIADVLEAELLLESGARENEKKKAFDLLHNVDLARLQSHGRIDILEHIGRLFARLEDWDNAIEALQRARRTGIVALKSEFLLANCYERTGQDDRAIDVYDGITSQRLPQPWAKATWFRLGVLRLRTQLGGSGPEQWDEIQAASDELSSVAPASEEAFLMRMYLGLAKGNTDRSAVIAELKAVESRFNRSVRYWLLCIDVYRQLEEFTLLQEAVDRLAAVTASVPDSRTTAANQPIMTIRLSPDDLKHIQQFADTWREKSAEERLDAVRRWCEDVPDSISARFALVNLGTALGRSEIIEKAVQSLRGIEGGMGYFWRIADVHKHLVSFGQGNSQDGAAAQRQAEELVEQYPGDPNVCRLAALCQETCGDVRTASEHYQKAVEIDASDLTVDGRLRTLVHQRDWKQALDFVEQLPAESWLTPERFELVVHVLCEHRKFSTAMRAIEQAVEKAGRHTAKTRYLLAVVRMREPSRENAIDAHQQMLRAVEQSPDNLNYWIALFHLEINYHPEFWTRDACRTANRIQWLLEAHGEDFAPAWSSLILAQTLQLQGRLAEADAFFRKTLTTDPESNALGWIPIPILSKDVTATDSPVTPEVAWLAGDESARTLAAIQALWSGQAQTGLEIPDDHSRLNSLLAVRIGDDKTAIQRLEAMAPQQRGCGDLLLLAALCDRTDVKPAARQHRMTCITQPGVPQFAIREVLDHAMAMDDFELARECVALLDDQSASPVYRQLIEARIELATGPLPENFEAWIRRRQQNLTDKADRQAFSLRIADILADRGEVTLAGRLMAEAFRDHPHRSRVLRLWLTSHPSLTELAMRSLSKATMEEPPAVVIQMLYRLTLHLPEDSPHCDRLIDLSKSMLEEAPEATPTDWTRLASAFERLMRPELALRACEKALPEDGSPSLVEHYLVWLKDGYLRKLLTAQQDLGRLTRLFGPRDDLMDTRAILFLRDNQADEAAQITRELTLHEPLDATYQVNHRLATACLLPPDQRNEELLAIDQKHRQDASVLAREILDELLESKKIAPVSR